MKKLLTLLLVLAAHCAFGASGKISDMTQTNSLAPTLTLVEVSVPSGAAYVTRSITFSNLMGAFKTLGFTNGFATLETVNNESNANVTALILRLNGVGTNLNLYASTTSATPLTITPITGGTNNAFQVNGTNGVPAIYANSNSASMLFPDGTALLPSISWAADNDTGLYRPTANRVAIACNGSHILEVNTTGIILTSGSLLQWGTAASALSRPAAGTIQADQNFQVAGNLTIASNTFYRAFLAETNVSATLTNFVVNFNRGDVELPSNLITNHINISHTTNGPAAGTGTNCITTWAIQTGNTNRHLYLPASLQANGFGEMPVASSYLLSSNRTYKIVFESRTGLISGSFVSRAPKGARLDGYTVASLPAGTIGDMAYVTDALTPTYLVALVGGGAVVTPCFYNGAAWVAY